MIVTYLHRNSHIDYATIAASLNPSINSIARLFQFYISCLQTTSIDARNSSILYISEDTNTIIDTHHFLTRI